MTLHNYLLFILMIYILGRCIAQGRKAGVLAAVGITLDAYVHLTAAVLGLSAILATSALAFRIVKWMGAGYLIYLGIRTLRSREGVLTINAGELPTRSGRTILWQGFVSDVLNPKVAMFYLAFLPQFIDVNAAHPTLEIAALGFTANVIALPINIAIVGLSAKLTSALRGNGRISKWLNKALGAMFVALGVRLAVEKI
jgi:threonine/homoserine/homoserine lactone efflux protein